MHGAISSTAAERRSGLAAEVLRDTGLAAHDVLFVFSTSGVNPYPVELAVRAVDAGCPVVAVTSVAASALAPRRAGTTLAEVATVVLDNVVPPGDATYPADQPVTAAISTVATAFLWNLLMVRLFDKAAEQNVRLPLWRSANVEGGDAANADLLRRYQTRIPQLAQRFGTSSPNRHRTSTLRRYVREEGRRLRCPRVGSSMTREHAGSC